MYRPSHPATGVSYYAPPFVFPQAGYPFVGPSPLPSPYFAQEVGCIALGAAPGGVTWQEAGYKTADDCASSLLYQQFQGKPAPDGAYQLMLQVCNAAPPRPSTPAAPSAPAAPSPTSPYWQFMGYSDAQACVTDSIQAGWSQPDALAMCQDTGHGTGTTPLIPLAPAPAASSSGLGWLFGLAALGGLLYAASR